MFSRSNKITVALLCMIIVQAQSAPGAPQQANASRFATPVAANEAAALKRQEDQALGQAEQALRDMAAAAKTEQEKALLQSDQRIVAELRKLVLRRQALRASATTAPGGTGAIGAAAGGDSQAALLTATKQMQETQMSFNLQYLQLQSQMQNENRSYAAVSNIMKTKHDTVKNSISNIR
jgi:hypothetical protein